MDVEKKGEFQEERTTSIKHESRESTLSIDFQKQNYNSLRLEYKQSRIPLKFPVSNAKVWIFFNL